MLNEATESYGLQISEGLTSHREENNMKGVSSSANNLLEKEIMEVDELDQVTPNAASSSSMKAATTSDNRKPATSKID